MKAFYDQIANEYYDDSHKTTRCFDRISKDYFTKAGLQLSSDGFVLEMGAGRGRSKEYLNIANERIIQLDVSESMLKVEPREDCLIRIKHEAENLPFLCGQFQLVTAFLCDPYWGYNMINEAFRVLKPKGKFIATMPSFEWGENLRREINIEISTTRFKKRDNEIVIIPSIILPTDRIKAMLETAGFDNIDVFSEKISDRTKDSISDDIELAAKHAGKKVEELDIINIIIAEKL